MPESFDVVVIGGGTAGLVTASGCARLGRKVAMIDRARLGGDCLWTGCVPTKSLVATARLVHSAAGADRLGLAPHRFDISPAEVMRSMRDARAIVERNDDPARFRALGIDVIEAEARLVEPGVVEAGGRLLRGRDIVIATGSRTAVPRIEGLEEAGYLDHVSFLAGDSFPSSVTILGGGAIGVEFAQLLRRLGSSVTVVEMAGSLVAQEDADVSAFVRQLLESEGVVVRTGWNAVRADADGKSRLVEIENASGGRESLRSDAIFVACGRRGNVENLGLESADVRVKDSWIVVDDFLRTTAPRVWACGDVHGGLQFTHVAAYEAVKLVRNLLFPGRSRVDCSNIPWALFTDPEVAHLGLTEAEARATHGDVLVYRTELREIDRAVVDRAVEGFVKVVASRKGRILGVHAVAPNASTLIGQYVVARERGMKVGDLARIVAPYPSLGDALPKTAAGYYESLSRGALGKLARMIARWTQ